MDLKAQITKVVEKVTTDKDLMNLFKTQPVKAVEKVLGVDLPDDVVNGVVEGVKAKISVDKVSGIADSLKKLF